MASEGKRAKGRAATREAILDAAINIIAEKGADNLALTDVVRVAGIHRATAYQHFKTRDDLIKAAAKRFSEKFYSVVIGDSGVKTEPADVIDTNIRLSNFVIDNPELCRVWLFNVLGSSDPSGDKFWKELEAHFGEFYASDRAQKGLDAEVVVLMVMAGAILWPIWTRAHAKSAEERRELAERFSIQLLRLMTFGSMKPEYFPEVVEFLDSDAAAQKRRAGVSSKRREPEP